MTMLKYPCEHAFHVFKERLVNEVQSMLKDELNSLHTVVQKIDYRASFGPYICEEKFNVFDEFERITQAAENDVNDAAQTHEAKAEPKIDDFYRTLGHDEQRATEFLIFSHQRWIVAWQDQNNVDTASPQATQSNCSWPTIDNTLYKLASESTPPATTLHENRFDTTWNLGKQTHQIAEVTHANVKAKIMLRHPESSECLGTLTLYIKAENKNLIASVAAPLAQVLAANDDLLKDLENAYAEMRELRRLALQKFNLSKVSRYLFKQKSLDIEETPSFTSNFTDNGSEADIEDDAKSRRFLPRILDATNTVLSFLGQYAQARHAILLEVYEDSMVDIYQTWSSTLEDTFTPERLAQGFAEEMRQEQQFLEDEINALAEVTRCFSDEIFCKQVDSQKVELEATIEVEILKNIFAQQKVVDAPLNQQAPHQVILPDGLKLRAIEHLLSSNEVFGGRGPQVKWYVAFIDRVDSTVNEGSLHRWNMQAGDYLQSRMQSELTHTVEILANELKFYLRSYKDQCKQEVWSNELALISGDGFGKSSTKWLNWLGDFVRQRVFAESCEFYLPNIYHKTLPRMASERYAMKPLEDLMDVIVGDIEPGFNADAREILQLKENDWSAILRLVNTPQRSILFVSICERHRHSREDTMDQTGYSTQWSLALTNIQQRFSYVHLFLLEKIVRQVARVRRQAIKSQFHVELSNLFHHENALEQAIKALNAQQKAEDKPVTERREIPKEYQLAENILNVLQEHIIKPFIGLELPMLLATQNTTGHVIHMASNRPLSAQFELDDDALFVDGKETLNKLLNEMHERVPHREFEPGELVMARPGRELQAGRYVLAVRLELLSGHLFDGVLLVMGRHNRAFDKWAIRLLGDVARAIVPILSISCINHQTHAQMGLFQHAVNSPVQGIISNAKSVIRRVKQRIGDLNLEGDQLDKLQGKIREATSRIDRNAEQLRSWKRSLQALFGNVRVDLSRRKNLVADVEYWVDRYREWASLRGITLRTELPKFPFSIIYDEDRMDIAFSNILDNAIKYSEKNRDVLVSVAVDGAYVTISVTNYGPYIDDSAKARLLSFGQRSKLVAESMIDGQGIGLPVVHAFVQAHPYGELQIHSKQLDNKTAKTRFTIRFRDNERNKLT